MKTEFTPHRRRVGFTLIELLVVIAIIGILAALLLPVFSIVKGRALVSRARTEMNGILTAIGQYETMYSRMPFSLQASSSLTPNCPDFTYGTANLVDRKGQSYAPGIGSAQNSGFQANNSEIMAILMDLERFPFDNSPTVNSNHVKNPQKHVFLTPKQPASITEGGVGPDLVYRDPWGNPYIITLDMNGDHKARDGFYRDQAVSQKAGTAGHNGLVNSADPNGQPNNFEANVTVMIWSMGLDGKIDPGSKANVSTNKDNILNW